MFSKLRSRLSKGDRTVRNIFHGNAQEAEMEMNPTQGGSQEDFGVFGDISQLYRLSGEAKVK